MAGKEIAVKKYVVVASYASPANWRRICAARFLQRVAALLPLSGASRVVCRADDGSMAGRPQYTNGYSCRVGTREPAGQKLPSSGSCLARIFTQSSPNLSGCLK